MIIKCGSRRLVSDNYGWKIQKLHTFESGKNKGKKEWQVESPGYPANLPQALGMIYERELKDHPDMDITEVAKAAEEAAHAVVKYSRIARRSA